GGGPGRSAAEGNAGGGGGEPKGASSVHAGVPPRPLAFVRTQTSFFSWKSPAVWSPPPNMIIRLFAWSYATAACSRIGGRLPVGASVIHAGAPPVPSALVSTRTSFWSVPG